ncbi:NotI family restriction endonuclease [Saccharothrix deserti]|uniref:NotI family restriction endonuclease n=1 Tax=Saccharothrix deserti TaxID=2593674 RepID=UPI00131C7768|nr:NotI family restriction endonuclease [Saccharothrix deserti]
MTNGNGKRSPRGTVFPIVEAYGFPYDSTSPEALKTWEAQACPFAGGTCEKQRQYGFGYCSVTYAAKWNNQVQNTYAVCDHRLDGPPVKWAAHDYFGDAEATLVPEVTVTDSPKLNIDFVAFAEGSQATKKYIAIETQAIDLRGGGVGPAWRAWEAGDVANWRSYFTEEAARKGRKDTIDYGVNTGNVYKRLGTQVAVKGEYLKQIEVPLYVVMQQSILQQLRSRVNFTPIQDGDQWDITFAGFEYTGAQEPNGQLKLERAEVVRTTLASYVEAMTSSGEGSALYDEFVAKVQKKLKTSSSQASLFPEL